jgi:methylated-DNA-protein-cysteine methyltransferase-like protein
MAPHDTFPQRVWHIVASIPEGYVTTYGEVARLAGSPRAARQVGGVLKRLPEGSTLPWHRVVNRHGDISLTGPDLQRQRQALLAEGVQVSGSGHIDLSIIAGFIEGKKKPPSGGVASLLGDRNGGLLDRNQRQVGMSAALVYYRLHGIGNKHQLAVNRDRRA